MLCFRLGGEPGRISREKGKRRVRILAIFGEVEVHASDEVPCRIAALEELLNVDLRFRKFCRESGIEFLPQRAEHLRSEVLAAGHRRRDGYQMLDFLSKRYRDSLARTLSALLGAQGRHVACANLAPVGDDG